VSFFFVFLLPFICLALAVACSRGDDEPFPPVREVGLFEPQTPCIAALPPSPFEGPAEKPSDPRTCLGKAWNKRTLPAELTVVNGVVQEVRFYSQCEGKVVQVEPAARECAEASLKTWRYKMVGPLCPGHDSTWTEVVFLRPSSAGRGAGGCGG
jgi:hypothetical protein